MIRSYQISWTKSSDDKADVDRNLFVLKINVFKSYISFYPNSFIVMLIDSSVCSSPYFWRNSHLFCQLHKPNPINQLTMNFLGSVGSFHYMSMILIENSWKPHLFITSSHGFSSFLENIRFIRDAINQTYVPFGTQQNINSKGRLLQSAQSKKLIVSIQFSGAKPSGNVSITRSLLIWYIKMFLVGLFKGTAGQTSKIKQKYNSNSDSEPEHTKL